ncbi:MAG: TrmH family RNA methyltransferase [Kineosporiaceae bacterium]
MTEHPPVGVGPWPGGPDAWPADPRLDLDLLRDGDARNVVDAYRYWSVEAIRADLAARARPFHVAVENLGRDLNIGSVVRTANAFNAAAVHVVGRRRWNRRGAMVTDRYLDVRYHEDASALGVWARDGGLAILGVDNVAGSVPLETHDLPERVVLLFGEEGPGLTPQALAVSDAVLAITQFGSTRSLNVGAAAGIAVHAWVRRWVFDQRPGAPVAPPPGVA